MIRKIRNGLIGLLIMAAITFFGLGPGYLESSMNKIDGQPPIEDLVLARATVDPKPIGALFSAGGLVPLADLPPAPEQEPPA